MPTPKKTKTAAIVAKSETVENIGNISEQQVAALDNTVQGEAVPAAANMVVGEAHTSDNPVIAALAAQKESNEKHIAEHGTATDAALVAGQNKPPTAEQQLRDDCLDYYKPLHKLPEATADARETLSTMRTVENELDGTLLARLTRDLADAGFFFLQEKKISVGQTMSRDLIKVLSESPNGKAAPMLGAVETIKDDGKAASLTSLIGDKLDEEGREKTLSTNAVVDVVSPYGKDKKTMARVYPASLRACLVLAGHVTRVQWGYIRKSECSGKRFTRSMVFLPRYKINEAEIAEYYEAVCVPNNVISPYVYTMDVSDRGTHILTPKRASDNNTLRYLVDDWAFALYQHHFAKIELAYDVECPKDKGIPSGILLRQPPSKREVRAPGVAFAPKTFEEFKNGSDKEKEAFFKEQQKTIAEAREAAQGKPNTEHFAVYVNTLAGLLKDNPDMTLPSHVIASCLRIGRYAIHAAIKSQYNAKVPPVDVSRELIAFDRELSGRIEWNDKTGLYLWKSETDQTLGSLNNGSEKEKTAEPAAA